MQASKDNQEVRNNCGGGGYWACFHGNLPVEGEGDGDGIDGGLCVDVYECNMVDQMALTEKKKKDHSLLLIHFHPQINKFSIDLF